MKTSLPRKYEWQRVSATRMEVWSGHLKLELDPGYGSRSWADSRRRPLIAKLPEFFTTVEEKNQAAQDKREKLTAYHAQQIQEWKEAIPRAEKPIYSSAMQSVRENSLRTGVNAEEL
ncbi:hypothetical protein [Bifidobacterium psychraerophilum]|uniref:Uncharacterized protein n=1 Tax=Bifidobacterium psychraerophilum TaxID=218140 RepID=A0A087CCP7_9BIFI|nr:hypothetical protein [Bifidobacterium psychraerophilum]KFI81047.1 hypothetical protein BPSY_1455 [Bifidobacterium psychraerophilum]PKA95392.1 hypothetical protein A9A89_1657 [Bifidobacterium psychraerophilum DSM 22366]